MSYSQHRYEALRRLGVEELPTLFEPSQHDNHDEHHNQERRGSEPRNSYDVNEAPSPFAMELPIRKRPVPGRRCPNCLARGQTFWVLPGKRCSQCGTEVN